MVELPDCHHVFHHTCVNRCQKPMLTDPDNNPTLFQPMTKFFPKALQTQLLIPGTSAVFLVFRWLLGGQHQSIAVAPECPLCKGTLSVVAM